MGIYNSKYDSDKKECVNEIYTVFVHIMEEDPAPGELYDIEMLGTFSTKKKALKRLNSYWTEVGDTEKHGHDPYSYYITKSKLDKKAHFITDAFSAGVQDNLTSSDELDEYGYGGNVERIERPDNGKVWTSPFTRFMNKYTNGSRADIETMNKGLKEWTNLTEEEQNEYCD